MHLRKLLIVGNDKSTNLITLSEKHFGRHFKDIESIKDDVQELIFQASLDEPVEQGMTDNQRLSLQIIYKFLNELERMKNNNPPASLS